MLLSLIFLHLSHTWIRSECGFFLLLFFCCCCLVSLLLGVDVCVSVCEAIWGGGTVVVLVSFSVG